MTLDDYLNQPGAMSATDLGRRIGLQNADHLRAWRHGYGGRKPSPKFCVAIERETAGAVTRQDLRPEDYWLHWPDLRAPKAAVVAKPPAKPKRVDVADAPVADVYRERNEEAVRRLERVTSGERRSTKHRDR